MLNKKLVVCMSFLLFVVLFVGCGSSEKASTEGENEEQSAEGENEDSSSNTDNFNVILGGEVIENDDTFVVEGTSNLLPGAIVEGQVWVIDSNDEEPFSMTTASIEEDGSWNMELEHHGNGDAEISVSFHFEGIQDATIVQHYGRKGENLEGPYVYRHKGSRDILQKAEVSVSYSAEEELSSITFEEPTWYEQPEDYGDPLVWVEVDEIQDDEEYFYLHGRSNILEGSKITGAYGQHTDGTSINPDGSFDLKIRYEQLEDTSFVIEFRPNHSQWSEIEETYGAEGEKLEGDLVEVTWINKYKYIEKVIDVD